MDSKVFKRKNYAILPNFGFIGLLMLAVFGLWLLREPRRIDLYAVNVGLVLLLINIFWKSRERIIVTAQGLDIYQIPRHTVVAWNQVAYINYTDHPHAPQPYLVLHQTNASITEEIINRLSNDNQAYRVIYLDRWEHHEPLIELINQQLQQQPADQVRVQFNLNI